MGSRMAGGGDRPVDRERPASAGIPGGQDHVAGLNGLRAISVLVVMLYHAHLPWMRGGYLGVEVFFGISGFLITRGLLQDKERLGLGFWAFLGRFWKRRMGRLFPALYAFLLVVTLLGAFALGARAAQFRGDLLYSALYMENWHQILSGSSYFADQGVPLLRHIWSLAVEEQFYFVWPLIVAGVLWTCRSGRKVLAGVAAGLALVSLGRLLLLADPGNASSVAALDSLNRAYLGTDTRAFGLLAGALLAIASTRPGRAWKGGRWLEAAAAAALAGLVALCVCVDIQDPFLYRGGFQVVDLLTLVLIVYLLGRGTGPVGRLLACRPFEWIGQRSYGIYLWHWLIFRLVGEGREAPAWIVLRWGLTFLVAWASYRWFEQPILDRVRGHVRETGTSRGRQAWRWVGVTAGGLLFAVATRASVQIAHLPAYRDEVQESLQLNARALDTIPGTAPGASGVPISPSQVPQIPDAASLKKNDPLPGVPPLVPPAVPALGLEGLEVTAIGDSVMKGAAIALKTAGEAYLGSDHICINAEESRPFARAYDILKTYKDESRLGDVVVIHLGTNNSSIPDPEFRRLAGLLADRRLVLFVTAKSDKTEICDGVNSHLLRLVRSMPNARVYDWKAATALHPELFYADQTHLRPGGARCYAALLMAQIDQYKTMVTEPAKVGN